MMRVPVRRANSCLRDEAGSILLIRSRFRLFLPVTGQEPTGFFRRLKPFRLRSFAAGPQSLAKRRLSAQAGASFRRASRRRRFFAPGSAASARLASPLFHPPAFSALSQTERFVSWRRRAKRAFRRRRSFSRSAGPRGRALVQTAVGSRHFALRESRLRR